MTGQDTQQRFKSVLYDALNRASASDMRARAKPVHLPARGLIYGVGTEGDTMLVIDTGRVEISITAEDGRRTILAQLGPGEIVGEMALLDGAPRSADATAATDVTGRFFTRADIAAFLRNDPDAAMIVITALSKRLRTTNSHIVDHMLSDGPTRLARLLMRVLGDWGKPQPDGSHILDQGFSQSDLGDMAGLSRETVNRLIRKWEEAGHLTRDGASLVVRDLPALVQLAQVELNGVGKA